MSVLYRSPVTLNHLPDECLKHIFNWMTLVEKVAVERVSKRFLFIIDYLFKYEQTKLTFGPKFTFYPGLGCINKSKYREEEIKRETLVPKTRKYLKNERHIESITDKAFNVKEIKLDKVPLTSTDLLWLVKHLPKVEVVELKSVYWSNDDNDFDNNWQRFCEEICPRLVKFSFKPPTIFYGGDRNLTYEKLLFLVTNSPLIKEFNLVDIRVSTGFTLNSAIRLVNSLPHCLLHLQFIPDKNLFNEIYSMLSQSIVIKWNRFHNLKSLHLGLIHGSLVGEIGKHSPQLHSLTFSLGPDSEAFAVFADDWFPNLNEVTVRIQSIDCCNSTFSSLLQGLLQFGNLKLLRKVSLRCKRLMVEQFKLLCETFHAVNDFTITCCINCTCSRRYRIALSDCRICSLSFQSCLRHFTNLKRLEISWDIFDDSPLVDAFIEQWPGFQNLQYLNFKNKTVNYKLFEALVETAQRNPDKKFFICTLNLERFNETVERRPVIYLPRNLCWLPHKISTIFV